MTAGTKGSRQYQGLFSIIPFKFAADFASAIDGDESALNFTVPGAALADFVEVSFSLDLADLVISASVTAADIVTVVVANNTGGTIDLAAGEILGIVKAPNQNVFAQL